eukprot:13072975-Heterocapsa_arctica.AAC.1
MQTIDGDEFISEKECIILLCCDKSKWGDTENHYDLMHPMIQHTCKGKTYTRRSEIQQIEYQKHEDINITSRQRQTRIGDETLNRHTVKILRNLHLRRKVVGGEIAQQEKHDKHNNNNNVILYTEEKEDGPILTSANLSGSQFDFEFMLDH